MSNNKADDFDHGKFDEAMHWLHKLGDFDTNKILDSEPLALIKETSRKLSEAITLVDGVLSPTMKHKLANDIFVFSGFKTMHQLKEASLLLSDKDGIKPFSKFLSDVRKIDDAYNVRYLRAEYEFAVASVEMASRWEDFSDTEGVLLQYRTAEDDKVRASHREINKTTLPKSDPFWKKYYPPNDWGCRCTAVEVMEDDYPRTDSDEAMKNGENTLTTAKQKLFEFNAGAEQKVFPDKHPYYSCRIKGSCDKVNLAAKISKTSLCQGCKLLESVLEHYDEEPTENGSVLVSHKHGVNERDENVEIATYLANKYGYHFMLLPLSNKTNTKSADVFNTTLRRHQEFKRPAGTTYNNIDNIVRKASKQANHIVLDISDDNNINNYILLDAICSRVRKCNNVTHITIIRNNNDITYTRKELLDMKLKQP